MTLRLSLIGLVLLAAMPLAQAGKAPQIESITAAQMRADLFFLASDAMQGRLTDTRENAIAADWVSSRFERLGLKPGGQGGSFDHRYFLMKASLGSRNELTIGGRDAINPSQSTLGQDFYPHRFSANGSIQAGTRLCRFRHRLAASSAHDDYRDAVQGRIVLILDREPGVNDPASKFDGLVTAEAAQPLRKVLAAQEKGASGVIFVEDVHNQAAASNFQAQAANYWPATRAAGRALHAQDLGGSRCASPLCRCRAQWRSSWWPRAERSLLDLARSAETRGGVTPVPIGQHRRSHHQRRPSHRARSQRRRDARRQRPGAQERVRAHQRALRSRWR